MSVDCPRLTLFRIDSRIYLNYLSCVVLFYYIWGKVTDIIAYKIIAIVGVAVYVVLHISRSTQGVIQATKEKYASIFPTSIQN